MGFLTLEELDYEVVEVLPDRALMNSTHICQGNKNCTGGGGSCGCGSGCTGLINVCGNCISLLGGCCSC